MLCLSGIELYSPWVPPVVRIKKKKAKGKIVLKRDQTEKKNGTKKQKTASPEVEPVVSAGTSNSLNTAPQ